MEAFRTSSGSFVLCGTRPNSPLLKQSKGAASRNRVISVPDDDLMSPFAFIGEVNGFKKPILRGIGNTVDIVSRNRIRPEMLTGQQIWIQQPFDQKPIYLPLAELELKGKFDHLKTKAAVVCSQADKGRYLLGNRTATLLGKDSECLIFLKMNILHSRDQKRMVQQETETGEFRNNFYKGTKTKELRKFRISKIFVNYASMPRYSYGTSRTRETVNQLNAINEKKRLQVRKYAEIRSPATRTVCLKMIPK
ncbi:hypothetical protein AVEN_73660-1 [Araneus ventricosus]|uniref:Uncharacterized protein n=1 Tax=Araneus ventricosus TaxID=182803 RepID=A0A4Y2HQI5_ARAVE|nr:hypothetical protein AVEN_73660-1 [Araneus ventricosus]